MSEAGALGGIVIREAGRPDLPAIHTLVERAYRGPDARGGWSHEVDLLGGSRSDMEQLGNSLTDPDHAILVAQLDGAIAG